MTVVLTFCGLISACLFEMNAQSVTLTKRWENNQYDADVVAISSDSRTVVSGGGSGNVILYDAATGDSIGGWQAHSDKILDVASCRQSPIVATLTDREIKVWSLQTQQLIISIPLVAKVPSHNQNLAVSPSGAFVGAGWGGHEFVIFRVETGRRLEDFHVANRSAGTPWFIDDQEILIAMRAGPSAQVARVINYHSNAIAAEFPAQSTIITRVRSSSDGNILLASNNQSVRIFDRLLQKVVWTSYLGQSGDDGRAIMLTPGGSNVIVSRYASDVGQLNGTQVIFWPTNTVVGLWDKHFSDASLAQDSSFIADGSDNTAYTVAIKWPVTQLEQIQTQAEIHIHPTNSRLILTGVPDKHVSMTWSVTDLIGRQVASGDATRTGDSFEIQSQELPCSGAYIFHCTAASQLLGAWKILLP